MLVQHCSVRRPIPQNALIDFSRWQCARHAVNVSCSKNSQIVADHCVTTVRDLIHFSACVRAVIVRVTNERIDGRMLHIG